MTTERDESGKSLSDRIAKAQGALEPKKGSDYARSYSMASMAWRITLELVLGTLIGFAIGWGLDRLFGTSPALLIVFGLFGVGAGLRVAIGSAQELSRQSAAEKSQDPGESRDDGAKD